MLGYLQCFILGPRLPSLYVIAQEYCVAERLQPGLTQNSPYEVRHALPLADTTHQQNDQYRCLAKTRIFLHLSVLLTFMLTLMLRLVLALCASVLC